MTSDLSSELSDRSGPQSATGREETPGGWGTFWLAAPVVFMVSLDATVVVAAFPALRHHFSDASPANLSWALNGYTIVYAALLVACGRLADRYGSKRCFLHGLALFTVASAACAVAGGAIWLAAARVLQAVGAALLTPASLTLMLTDFPPAQRQKAVSLWSAVGALAAALGPVIGSLIIDWVGWPMIFLINVPVGMVVWWRARRGLAESKRLKPEGGFDWLGTAMLILGIGAIAHGIVRSGEMGWRDQATIGSLVVGLVLLGAFVNHVKGREDGALDLGLFDDTNYRWASVATFVFGAALGMMFLSFYLFMTGIWHFQQSVAGMAATPGPMVVTLVAIFTTGWSTRFGHRALLIAGGLLFACSNLWFFVRIGTQANYLGTWLPGQLLTGTAIGLMLPTLSGAAVAGLQPSSFSVGNAVNAALRQLGNSVGVAIAIALIGDPHSGLEKFRTVYGSLALAGILIGLMSLPIRTRRVGSIQAPVPA